VDREVDDIEALAALASETAIDGETGKAGGTALAGETAIDGATVFVHGTSSGAALALEAAKRIPAIGKLAVYEPLLGRTTCEGFAAAFGGQSGGMADQMNNTPKFVVSDTLTSADWQNSTLISGSGDDVAAKIRELKQQPGRNIGMSGSSTRSATPSAWSSARCVSMTAWRPKRIRRCARPTHRWRSFWPVCLMSSDVRMRTGYVP